jgi:nucleoid DNA-binding protein
VTKQDFAEKLSRKTDISKAKAIEVIDTIFSTKPGHGIIAIELDAGRDMTITGFGTFKTRWTKARMGRNPQTGEAIHIAARNSISFRAGKGLKSRVADLPASDAPSAAAPSIEADRTSILDRIRQPATY